MHIFHYDKTAVSNFGLVKYNLLLYKKDRIRYKKLIQQKQNIHFDLKHNNKIQILQYFKRLVISNLV